MISGNNIFIRALETNDVDFIYYLENDVEIWKYGTTIAPLSKDNIKGFIHNSNTYDIYTLKQLRLIICRKTDHQAIGCIDITDFNPKNRRATIGIVLMKDERHKGYADEALKAICDYTFNILNLNQLYCEIADNNYNSIKLFTHNGFKLCGTKRNWIITDNGWQDVSFYQKLNTLIP